MSAFAPVRLDACNPGPMTGSGNNTYLLFGQSGDATLVDAGVGDELHLFAIDAELRARRARLVRVIATHGHRDHVAGAPALAQRHPEAVFAKMPWPGDDDADGVEWRRLAEGDEIDLGSDTLRVLQTPGHAPDHLAFWHEAARAVFTGDLVIAGSSVMIQWSRGGRIEEYLRSLERLIALAPLTLYPAHGPVIGNPIEVLTHYLEHRRERERQVIDALGRGRSSVAAIADSIYDGLEPTLLAAAQENVRAHLEKLKAEGQVVDDRDRWLLIKPGVAR
jgi:glyoxylase-like metal-dependent hydrolase (beta-lactamase superfamily II)